MQPLCPASNLTVSSCVWLWSHPSLFCNIQLDSFQVPDELFIYTEASGLWYSNNVNLWMGWLTASWRAASPCKPERHFRGAWGRQRNGQEEQWGPSWSQKLIFCQAVVFMAAYDMGGWDLGCLLSRVLVVRNSNNSSVSMLAPGMEIHQWKQGVASLQWLSREHFNPGPEVEALWSLLPHNSFIFSILSKYG